MHFPQLNANRCNAWWRQQQQQRSWVLRWTAALAPTATVPTNHVVHLVIYWVPRESDFWRMKCEYLVLTMCRWIAVHQPFTNHSRIRLAFLYSARYCADSPAPDEGMCRFASIQNSLWSGCSRYWGHLLSPAGSLKLKEAWINLVLHNNVLTVQCRSKTKVYCLVMTDWLITVLLHSLHNLCEFIVITGTSD